MIHPDTRIAWLGEQVGFGVVATAPIPAGTIVWVRDSLDRCISSEQVEALGPLFTAALRRFTFWEADGGDLVLCWDHARYVNHSCEANCLGGGFEFEVAVRDIAVGEQLTDDYGTFGYAYEMPCSCGAASCRGVIRRADSRQMAERWDALLLQAMLRLTDVAQPLWSLVQDKERALRVRLDPDSLPRHWVSGASTSEEAAGGFSAEQQVR